MAQVPIASKVINFGVWLHPILRKHLVDFFLLAPYEIPVVPVGFLPFASDQARVDAIPEGGLELDVAAE